MLLSRKSNLSHSEISVLVEKVEEHLDVINSKFTNVITNQKKNNVWSQIIEAVNAVGNERHPLKEVKDKWKNMNTMAKN